jgi:hypothetical protein
VILSSREEGKHLVIIVERAANLNLDMQYCQMKIEEQPQNEVSHFNNFVDVLATYTF